jgi:hypothetical protein
LSVELAVSVNVFRPRELSEDYMRARLYATETLRTTQTCVGSQNITFFVVAPSVAPHSNIAHSTKSL